MKVFGISGPQCMYYSYQIQPNNTGTISIYAMTSDDAFPARFSVRHHTNKYPGIEREVTLQLNATYFTNVSRLFIQRHVHLDNEK